MRVALVSPYSWSFPGGVSRHVEALALQLLDVGHDVRVLAPHDPPGTLTRRLHVGHDAVADELPDFVVPLGRTVGVPSNGAVSNLSTWPAASARLRAELRDGAYDVVHLHEPVAPLIGWQALTIPDLPMVGTFHCYSEHAPPHALATLAGARRRLNHLGVRLAVSEAAAWTGRRFYGGEYRIVPNGVRVDGDAAAVLARRPARADGGPLRLLFVGQAVERKGLPVLLAAFDALRAHVPVELTLVGVDHAGIAPLLDDLTGVRALGKVDDAAKSRELRRADVLVAPSLRGESFGMVLTEAFAAGTPVVASDIAGYRDVVAHGRDGLLVAPGDPVALGGALRDLAVEPARRAALAAGAAGAAQRFAWPQVSAQVVEAYEEAASLPAPATAAARTRRRRGLELPDGTPPVPAVRLASLEPRAALAGSVVGVERIGAQRIVDALLTSNPTWVLVALALMCLSMASRAVAWRAILRAALPRAVVRMGDVLRATSIGVLMSATLPARVGEPARAMVMSRHLAPVAARGALGPVLGTIVSQTVLNLLALLVLGVTMFLTSSAFDGRQSALLLVAVVPLVLLTLVLLAPSVLRRGEQASSSRTLRRVRAALADIRSGLGVFTSPWHAAQATSAQLGAWAIQWLSCYALLVAFGLESRAGLGAAAAVLFAVNVTAVLPVTPSNLGVFQAACVAVLTGAYGIGSADALGFGIVLQAVEIACALVMGAPALLREGTSWSDMRLRTMAVAPVELPPLGLGASADRVASRTT